MVLAAVENVQPLLTPKDVLTHVLRRLGIAPQAKWTFERLPELEKAAEGLAWHFSDRLIYPFSRLAPNTVPLIDMCLIQAFERLDEVLERSKTEAVTMREAQTAFLAGLFECTPEVVHVKVGTEKKSWDPFGTVALSEWLPRHPGAVIEMRETDEERPNFEHRQIRLLMLTRVFPNGEAASINAALGEILTPSPRTRRREDQ